MYSYKLPGIILQGLHDSKIIKKHNKNFARFCYTGSSIQSFTCWWVLYFRCRSAWWNRIFRFLQENKQIIISVKGWCSVSMLMFIQKRVNERPLLLERTCPFFSSIKAISDVIETPYFQKFSFCSWTKPRIVWFWS
jgi:hypothetical protein